VSSKNGNLLIVLNLNKLRTLSVGMM